MYDLYLCVFLLTFIAFHIEIDLKKHPRGARVEEGGVEGTGCGDSLLEQDHDDHFS